MAAAGSSSLRAGSLIRAALRRSTSAMRSLLLPSHSTQWIVPQVLRRRPLTPPRSSDAHPHFAGLSRICPAAEIKGARLKRAAAAVAAAVCASAVLTQETQAEAAPPRRFGMLTTKETSRLWNSSGARS
eukprot:5266234-Pleurochrysis_carterae.AAC.3